MVRAMHGGTLSLSLSLSLTHFLSLSLSLALSLSLSFSLSLSLSLSRSFPLSFSLSISLSLCTRVLSHSLPFNIRGRGLSEAALEIVNSFGMHLRTAHLSFSPSLFLPAPPPLYRSLSLSLYLSFSLYARYLSLAPL